MCFDCKTQKNRLELKPGYMYSFVYKIQLKNQLSNNIRIMGKYFQNSFQWLLLPTKLTGYFNQLFQFSTITMQTYHWEIRLTKILSGNTYEKTFFFRLQKTPKSTLQLNSVCHIPLYSGREVALSFLFHHVFYGVKRSYHFRTPKMKLLGPQENMSHVCKPSLLSPRKAHG